MPPPKRASSSFSRRSSSVMSKPPSAQEKQALSNMFKRIESTDSALVKCSKCALMIKSCLMRDHLETKCEKTSKRRLTEDEIKQELLEIRSQRQPQLTQVKQRRLSQDEELIVLDDDDDDNDNDNKESGSKDDRKQQNETNNTNLVECRVEAKKIKTEVVVEDQNHGPSSHRVDSHEDKTYFSHVKNEALDVVVVKQRREDEQKQEESDDKLLLEFMEKEEENLAEFNSPSKLDSDYYLRNFTTAIEWVLNQETFSCLFDQSDYDVIKRFSLLSSKPSALS